MKTKADVLQELAALLRQLDQRARRIGETELALFIESAAELAETRKRAHERTSRLRQGG